MTTPMNNGRHAGTDRRRQRVQNAIATAVRDGTPLTASAIARAACVDRTFLYRHRDLLDILHTTGSRSARPAPAAGPTVTPVSLQADLANANARVARLAARVQQLENHLSRQLGSLAWHEAGLGAANDVAELQAAVVRHEQRNTELSRLLEERQAELEAARDANRQLTRALNQRE
ncbi:hypothetical protein ACH4OW_38020 [Streptomyces sp. NPDC017056]|uniref:hypothetical protein n=1 Tax=Streptomyces sp. NPDC017056 TaxID=3364973 RepID=UPI0037A1A5D5